MSRWLLFFMSITVVSILAGLTTSVHPQMTIIALMGFTFVATYAAIFMRRPNEQTSMRKVSGAK